MNKTEKIMLYLQEEKHINSWEAIQKFGATRLSAIIFNLRNKYNMNIRSQKRQFVDRYGEKTYFVDYILEENDEEKMNKEKNDNAHKRK